MLRSIYGLLCCCFSVVVPCSKKYDYQLRGIGMRESVRIAFARPQKPNELATNAP